VLGTLAANCSHYDSGQSDSERIDAPGQHRQSCVALSGYGQT